MDRTDWVAVIGESIELVAVAIVAVGLTWSLVRGGRGVLMRLPRQEVYESTRRTLAGVLLLSLEVLIAADIVRTVAVPITLGGASRLGMLVLIRTFLSWSIELEERSRKRPSRGAAAD